MVERVGAPRALVVRAPGTNRDSDVAVALRRAGAAPEIVLLAELARDPKLLDRTDLLVLAGGFSFADALGAGRRWAHELHRRLGPALHAFPASGRPLLGICNGFQALVRTALLPGGSDRAALGPNLGGHFECRWVTLRPASQRCVWTAGLDAFDCPIAHGEGRFLASEETLGALRANDQIALRYASTNPNGSVDDIAGICDASGVVLGLMPHPENHAVPGQHPRRGEAPAGGGGRLHPAVEVDRPIPDLGLRS